MPGASRHGAASALPGKAGRPAPAPGPGAGRAPRCEGAVVVPAVFAAGEQQLHYANVALLAAFGSVTMLLFMQFGGGLRRQLTANAAFAEASPAPVFLGTASSQPTWVAAAPLALSFAVLFSGVISSPLATAAPGMLINFLLPAPRSRPKRHSIRPAASGQATLAAAALIPPGAPASPLAGAAAGVCRALAAQIAQDLPPGRPRVARLPGGEPPAGVLPLPLPATPPG